MAPRDPPNRDRDLIGDRRIGVVAISEAKLKANRANAKKSTGPRSRKGKERSRLNALRHGILSNETLITAGEGAEDAQDLAELREALRQDFSPRGALEELLVDKIVELAWRWRRLLRYEAGATREQSDEVIRDWSNRQRADKTDDGWKETEDLEHALKVAEQTVAALAGPNPLDQPSASLAGALVDMARESDLDPVQVLGVEDLNEAIGSPTSRAQSCRCLFERLSRTDGTPSRFWERLRARSELRRDEAREELEVRQRQEDRLRMLSSLPALRMDDKVIRYEAHLSRELDRTLRQLDDLRRRRA